MVDEPIIKFDWSVVSGFLFYCVGVGVGRVWAVRKTAGLPSAAHPFFSALAKILEEEEGTTNYW